MENYFYTDGLVSKRLKTKFLTQDDIPEWAAFFEDEEAIEFFPNQNNETPLERSAFVINKQLKRYADQQFGVQKIILKSTKEWVGICGLLIQDVNGELKTEVGYQFFKQFWGNGYAPEAAKIFIDFAQAHQLSQDIISLIDVNNIKSQRVAEKNGLFRSERIIWTGLDIYVYRKVL